MDRREELMQDSLLLWYVGGRVFKNQFLTVSCLLVLLFQHISLTTSRYILGQLPIQARHCFQNKKTDYLSSHHSLVSPSFSSKLFLFNLSYLNSFKMVCIQHFSSSSNPSYSCRHSFSSRAGRCSVQAFHPVLLG